jgi:hypothetical protein
LVKKLGAALFGGLRHLSGIRPASIYRLLTRRRDSDAEKNALSAISVGLNGEIIGDLELAKFKLEKAALSSETVLIRTPELSRMRAAAKKLRERDDDDLSAEERAESIRLALNLKMRENVFGGDRDERLTELVRFILSNFANSAFCFGRDEIFEVVRASLLNAVDHSDLRPSRMHYDVYPDDQSWGKGFHVPIELAGLALEAVEANLLDSKGVRVHHMPPEVIRTCVIPALVFEYFSQNEAKVRIADEIWRDGGWLMLRVGPH